MITLLTLLGLLVLFYALGLSADLVIKHIRSIGKKLGVPVFFLGLVLGVLTSLPELGIGINALAQDIPSVSVGNLLGSSLVLLGLILGLSIVLNREIKTDGRTETLWPVLAYISLPLFMGLRGYLGFWTGLGMLLVYPMVLLYLYLSHESTHHRLPNGAQTRIVKEIAFIGLGLVGVIILSNLIVRMTLPVLTSLGVPAFLIGVIVYSIGTNLPELIVAVRSWRRQVRDLSFSNLIGSAIVNPALLGAFAMTKQLDVRVDLSYAILVIMTLLGFVLLLRFYRSGKRFSRAEGFALIAVYGIFLALQAPAFSAFAVTP